MLCFWWMPTSNEASYHIRACWGKEESFGIIAFILRSGENDDAILTDEDHSTAMKSMKKIAKRTNELTNLVVTCANNNNVTFMRAPFEAEWQCVCLEKHHIVDAVVSTDGDCIILGVKKLCWNVNFNTETFHLHDRTLEMNEKEKILCSNGNYTNGP